MSAAGAELRVVVADDQDVICAGFAALLDSQPGIAVVGTTRDGAALVDLVAAQHVDVAVVDVRMPVMDGIEATRRITESGASTRILVLTTFDLDEYVFSAVRAGASGFLLKDATAAQLVEAVRVVADGSMLLGAEASRRLVAGFSRPEPDHGGNRAASEPAAVRALAGLSARERDVLDLLARGRSNAEIAGALFIGIETVKSHVAEILRKLGLRDRIQVVVFAYENNVVAPGE